MRPLGSPPATRSATRKMIDVTNRGRSGQQRIAPNENSMSLFIMEALSIRITIPRRRVVAADKQQNNPWAAGIVLSRRLFNHAGLGGLVIYCIICADERRGPCEMVFGAAHGGKVQCFHDDMLTLANATN